MLRHFNSLTVRLVLIAVLSAGLILALGVVRWLGIIRLIVVNESISEAEDQENRLLTIQNLTYQADEGDAQREAFLAQIRLLMADFDTAQQAMHQQYQADANDAAVAQVIVTMDDTDTHWADTKALLEQFLAVSTDTAERRGLVDDI